MEYELLIILLGFSVLLNILFMLVNAEHLGYKRGLRDGKE